MSALPMRTTLRAAQRAYDARTPDDCPRQARREELAEQLQSDLPWLSETVTNLPLLSSHAAWKHIYREEGVTKTRHFPADHTGNATLQALMHGSDGEVLAAVYAMRAAVRRKAESDAEDMEADEHDLRTSP